MFTIFRGVSAFSLTILLAQSAQAYAIEPAVEVEQKSPQGTQLAQVCTPELSPQMAAAFGLPMAPPGAAQACVNR